MSAPAKQLELDASAILPEPPNPNHIRPVHIVAVALIAIAAWVGVAAFLLLHGANEGERAAILKQAEAVSLLAFGYFLGSSAGSRNKDRL